MKPGIIILILLTYIFTSLPIEITDNFLAYLIPFCIAIAGLLICILNFWYIKKSVRKYKTALQIANGITTFLFLLLVAFNFPRPESDGLRCKNWTDTEMWINADNHSQQYVSQSLRISGSLYSFRQAKVKPINSWLRWHHEVKTKPKFKHSLYIDNSKDGYNDAPFWLDNSKIDFQKDRQKAVFVKN